MRRASPPVKPAVVSSARTSFRGRSIPGGCWPSGVAAAESPTAAPCLGAPGPTDGSRGPRRAAGPPSPDLRCPRVVVRAQSRRHRRAVRPCSVCAGTTPSVSAHLVAEAAHRQAVDTVTVDDPQCSSQDHRPAYLAVMLAGRRGGRLGCVSACIRHGRPLRLLGHYVCLAQHRINGVCQQHSHLDIWKEPACTGDHNQMSAEFHACHRWIECLALRRRHRVRRSAEQCRGGPTRCADASRWQFTSNANATLNWCSCLSPPRPASETAGQRCFQHDAATGTVSWIRCDIGSFPHHSAASAVSRLKVRLAATGPTGSPAPLLANTTQRRRRGAAVN